MNLTISGHHLDVTPALREYVVSKLERIRRHFDQVVEVKVLLSVEKQKEKEKRQRAEKYLTAVGLEKFMNYYPAQLSGGMRQRAAIARAFAVPCDLLLMDEPFNGQDMKTKDELIILFLKLWKEEPKTVIAVTHSFSEAWLLGDRTLVLTEAPSQIAADINCFTPREFRAANIDCGEAKLLRQKIEEAFETPSENPGQG